MELLYSLPLESKKLFILLELKCLGEIAWVSKIPRQRNVLLSWSTHLSGHPNLRSVKTPKYPQGRWHESVPCLVMLTWKSVAFKSKKAYEHLRHDRELDSMWHFGIGCHKSYIETVTFGWRTMMFCKIDDMTLLLWEFLSLLTPNEMPSTSPAFC